MSRIPAPSSSRNRSPLKPSPSPTKLSTPSIRTRTQSTTAKSPKPALNEPAVRTRTKSTITKSAVPKSKIEAPPSPAVPLSIKEAIALKRAEAKKAQVHQSNTDFGADEELIPTIVVPKQEDELLGRWSIKETIERGRSSGSINLATRSLICLPSALFEIHLGITPDPLKSVPKEPPLPDDGLTIKRGGKRDAPAWFEAQDLQILKAWKNDIKEIQHEISLFGSLKVVDLHDNKLEQLPDAIADLCALTVLDVSHNELLSLPANLFSLPELTNLNVSHNKLTSLSLNAAFASGRRESDARTGSFFAPVIQRAKSPLPRLITLEASHNAIPANAIDLVLPQSLSKVDLSANPLGSGEPVQALLKHVASLPALKELRCERAEISDDAFPPDLLSGSSSSFPLLRFLDVGETNVTTEAVKSAMKDLKQPVTYDITTDDPPEGMLRIVVGKRIIREAWEIEVERKAKARAATRRETVKEDWELDADLTEGAKRRLRAQAAAQAQKAPPAPTPTAKSAPKKEELLKEAWEIEAEQGLLTEGGKRRARAAAAAARENPSESNLGIGPPPSKPAAVISTSGNFASLSSPQYYSQTTNTLTLPSSAPPTKMASHSRAFSVATPSSFSGPERNTADIAIPTPTLPLVEISAQSFASTLKVLMLVNRRMDRSISLPMGDSATTLLPCLEELSLEGCNLSDQIAVSRSSNGSSPSRSSEPLLPLLSKLFPSLQTLDLSYNLLTSSSLSTETMSSLLLSTPQKKGLKHLRLRGNKITELDGMQGVAEMFKGNREVPGWKLDELDIRDNEIGKLPAELGLLPLDVFLVDGNVFRVPARRIWEREGTKGLLSWLRGRME